MRTTVVNQQSYTPPEVDVSNFSSTVDKYFFANAEHEYLLCYFGMDNNDTKNTNKFNEIRNKIGIGHDLRVNISEREHNLIEDVDENLEVALLNRISWPGVLLVPREGGSKFYVLEHIYRALSHSMQNSSPMSSNGIRGILDNYDGKLNEAVTHIIHLSDLHLTGRNNNNENKEFEYIIEYLIKVKNNVLRGHEVIIAITGDLVDKAKDEHFQKAKKLINKLKFAFGNDQVMCIPGNHDKVDGRIAGNRRKPTYIADSYKRNKDIFVSTGEVRSVSGVVFVPLDTYKLSTMAKGRVDKKELISASNGLDRLILNSVQNISTSSPIVILMHHHPVEFEDNNWMPITSRLYERLLEMTNWVCLDDVERLNKFIKKYKISAVLYGHTHIPYYKYQNKVHYLGTGSATGKAKSSLSYNGRGLVSHMLLSINRDNGDLVTHGLFRETKKLGTAGRFRASWNWLSNYFTKEADRIKDHYKDEEVDITECE